MALDLRLKAVTISLVRMQSVHVMTTVVILLGIYLVAVMRLGIIVLSINVPLSFFAVNQKLIIPYQQLKL